MAVELASGYVSLAISTRGLGRDIGRQFAGVQGQADKAGRESGKRFAGAYGGAIKAGLVGAGIAGGVAAVKGLGSVVKAASGAQQAIGGVGAVFGKNAKEIEGASKRAATAAGLSTTAYQELATALGAGLKNQGVKDFTGATENLIGIGADLAAQFGGSSKEAVEALASAMRGESDPIERYGVSLNESAVNAELARKGQSKLTGQALITAKAEARLALITKQTGDAMGAFARENDTLAGKQQIAAAQWENLKTKIGTSFLPVATKAMGFISDKMIPAIDKLAGFLSKRLGPAFTEIKRGFGGFVAGFKFGSGEITSSADSLGGIGERVGAAFHNVGAKAKTFLAPLLPVLRDIGIALFKGLQENARAALPVLKSMAGALVAAAPAILAVFRTLGGLLVTYVIPAFTQIRGAMITFASQALPVIVAGFKVLAGFIITNVVPALGAIARFVLTNVVPGLMKIGSTVSGLARVVIPIVAQIVGAILGKFNEMRPQIIAIWGSVKSIITGVMGIVAQVVKIATHLIKVLWEKNGAGILKAVRGTFGGLVKIIGGVMKVVAGIVNLVLGIITGDWSRAGKALKTIVSGIKDVLVGIWKVLKNTIIALLGTLLSELRKKWDSFLAWTGSKLRAGLAKIRDFVLTPVRAARDKIKELMDQIANRFTSGVKAIGRAWDGLKAKAKAPIKFIIDTVINGGLIKAFNSIARKVGAKELANVPSFATGGVLPGYTPGRDVHRFVSPTGGAIDLSGGEGILRPELTRVIGKKRWDAANRAARQGKIKEGMSHLGGFADGGTVPGFAPGGIVDKVKGAASAGPGFVWRKITKLVKMGGVLKAALNKALGNLSGAGSTAFGDIGKAVARKASSAMYEKGKDWVQKIVTRVKEKITGGGGGPIGKGGYASALSYARRNEGHPYIFGSMWDCSGFISALHNIILGRGPGGRRYSTPAFHGARAQGFTRGKRSPFMIGVNPSPGRFGHMAGTLNGVNVESAGGVGVRVGGGARGWNNSMFSWRGGLARGGVVPRKGGDLPFDLLDPRGQRYNPMLAKIFRQGTFDTGGKLPPGLNLTYNGTRKPEAVLTTPQWDTAKKAIDNHSSARGGDTYYVQGLDDSNANRLAVAVEERQRRREALQPSYA